MTTTFSGVDDHFSLQSVRLVNKDLNGFDKLSLFVNHCVGQVNFRGQKKNFGRKKTWHIGNCIFSEFDLNKYFYMK